jgi:transcriptional regulator with XRE-family HTH domain
VKRTNNWKRNHTPFGEILRDWRKKKDLSQLDLSLDVGISAKHLSFVETGRSIPSRELILRISETLKLPKRQYNALLTSAGYAAEFSEEPLESPKFEMIRTALSRMLTQHAPYPAFVINSNYNLLMTNSGYDQIIHHFVDQSVRDKHRNILRITFDPKGLSQYIQNWAIISSFLLKRIWEEAVSTKNERLLDLHDELKKNTPTNEGNMFMIEPLLPVMLLSLKKDQIEADFFTTITTLGTPLDLTSQELRIESLFPANAATEKLFQSSDRTEVRRNFTF